MSDSNLSNLAIQAALSNEWEEAISLNGNILKENPQDINALNRMAFAYVQVRKFDDAKRIYKKILGFDRYNIIAQKNLDRINNLLKQNKSGLNSKNTIFPLSPSLFIEEPGKTKTVVLSNIAPSSVLSNLNMGDPVTFKLKKHSAEIRDTNNVYIGALPDDIAFRLIRFTKAGNTYLVNIKNITKNSVSVFIREIKRGKRFASQPTFISLVSEKNYVSHHTTSRQTNEDEDDNSSENEEDDAQEEE
ncbi:tetratricopeptide repeat protein [Patescibacteria group bacterium]|nr:tetratricopeptide repeat protein [Patescibacteria group bacterium]MCL5797523.1 tetratricopeptide repeat protein [Patescibacteria group bacterium]